VNPVAQDNKRRDARQAKNGDVKAARAAAEAPTVARRRVFLRLEADRESLAAQLGRRLRVRRRYEDLRLVKMVTRLQRDFLGQPTPGAKPPVGGTNVEYGIADWARPWGPTFLLQFQTDLNSFDLKLRSARRWLSAAAQRKADARAAERFASITAGMASQLEAADFELPSWATSGQLSRHAASRRVRRRAGLRAMLGRRAPRRSRARRAPAYGGATPTPGAPSRNGPRAARDGRLNLNQASFADLRALNLSSTQSRRLLAYRKRIGGYRSIDQLDDIPGFPSAVRERLKRQAAV
jgi:helix-hairpin-helix protein